MAAPSDRAEVDTARPFRSVKEAVAVFGDRILVGNSHSRHSSSSASAAAIANTPSSNTNTNATSIAATPTPSAIAKHEASSSSSTMTFSPTPMAEIEAEIMPATVPMYSAPSSPTSLASSSPSPPAVKPCSGRGGDGDNDSEAAAAGGLVTVRSIKKLEADVAETRQEVAQLRKRGNEMEMALASLTAQLHRGLSKLAEMEAAANAAARRRSVGGDTDTDVRSERWGGGGDSRLLAASSEYYLPSFSHALSLGEVDVDDTGELMGGSRSRRRKAQKVKPIVPLIGDILFSGSRRKSTKEKGDESFYSGDLYGVLG